VRCAVAFRATVSYLIVRDLVHEKVFAKALETLGVNWGKALPVPRIDTDKMPEVKDLENKNLHNIMWTFANNGEPNGMAKMQLCAHWNYIDSPDRMIPYVSRPRS
jgi:Mn-containing catalase